MHTKDELLAVLVKEAQDGVINVSYNNQVIKDGQMLAETLSASIDSSLYLLQKNSFLLK